MTDEDLRRLAEAATPGPWLVERDYPSPDVHDAKGNVIATTMHSDLSRQEDGANAAFIAAASSETVKRLLDRVAKAEADALAAHAAGRIAGMEEAAAWHDDRAKKEREAGSVSGAMAEEYAADAIRAAAKESK